MTGNPQIEQDNEAARVQYGPSLDAWRLSDRAGHGHDSPSR